MKIVALVGLLLLLLAAPDAAKALFPGQEKEGSFYAFHAPAESAPAECFVSPGTKVDDLCCAVNLPQEPAVNFAAATCNVNPGVFPDGSGARSYLGCDNGVQTYGENCYEGWLIPPDVDASDPLLTFNATSIDECECGFQISGTGCYKINDNFDFPQFPNTSLVFLYLDGPPCTSKLTTDGTTTAAPTFAPTTSSAGMSASLHSMTVAASSTTLAMVAFAAALVLF